MALQTIKVHPTAYVLARGPHQLDNMTVTNGNNALTGVDSDTYGTFSSGGQSGGTYNIAFYGFDFSEIPANKVVTDIAINFKGSGPSWSGLTYFSFYSNFDPVAYGDSSVSYDDFPNVYNKSDWPSNTTYSSDTVYTLNDFTYFPTAEDAFNGTNGTPLELSDLISPAIEIVLEKVDSLGIYGMEWAITYEDGVPEVNKVVYNGRTLIDLTQDTVTAEDVTAGVTFHLPSGKQTVGTNKGMWGVLDYSVIQSSTVSNGRSTSISINGPALVYAYDSGGYGTSSFSIDGTESLTDSWVIVPDGSTGTLKVTATSGSSSSTQKAGYIMNYTLN